MVRMIIRIPIRAREMSVRLVVEITTNKTNLDRDKQNKSRWSGISFVEITYLNKLRLQQLRRESVVARHCVNVLPRFQRIDSRVKRRELPLQSFHAACRGTNM